MEFTELFSDDADGISEMSEMAESIVREHYDPIIGKAQNDYMIPLFQSKEAIRRQLMEGSRYFFVKDGNRNAGFMAFYPRDGAMYLSKFYLYRSERGKGYARLMLGYVIGEAKKAGLDAVELNANRNNPTCGIYESLGFKIIRDEKNDIGNGFFMDDHVYRLEIRTEAGA